MHIASFLELALNYNRQISDNITLTILLSISKLVPPTILALPQPYIKGRPALTWWTIHVAKHIKLARCVIYRFQS